MTKNVFYCKQTETIVFQKVKAIHPYLSGEKRLKTPV